jgi:hypothetical protein
MHLRSLKRVRGEVSLYDPIGVDREGNEITLVDVRKNPSPDGCSKRKWRRPGCGIRSQGRLNGSATASSSGTC